MICVFSDLLTIVYFLSQQEPNRCKYTLNLQQRLYQPPVRNSICSLYCFKLWSKCCHISQYFNLTICEVLGDKMAAISWYLIIFKFGACLILNILPSHDNNRKDCVFLKTDMLLLMVPDYQGLLQDTPAHSIIPSMNFKKEQ